MGEAQITQGLLPGSVWHIADTKIYFWLLFLREGKLFCLCVCVFPCQQLRWGPWVTAGTTMDTVGGSIAAVWVHCARCGHQQLSSRTSGKQDKGFGSQALWWLWVWDQHHKVATVGTRRSKPAPSETLGSGAGWHQFVGLFLCVGGKWDWKDPRASCWGHACLHFPLMDLPPDPPERGAGWGCWCYPVHARVFLAERTCVGVYLSSPCMRKVAGTC